MSFIFRLDISSSVSKIVLNKGVPGKKYTKADFGIKRNAILCSFTEKNPQVSSFGEL